MDQQSIGVSLARERVLAQSTHDELVAVLTLNATTYSTIIQDPQQRQFTAISSELLASS
jgi:hypothetical protein